MILNEVTETTTREQKPFTCVFGVLKRIRLIFYPPQIQRIGKVVKVWTEFMKLIIDIDTATTSKKDNNNQIVILDEQDEY